MDENLRELVRGTLLGLLEAESPLIEGDGLRKKINGRALTEVVNGGRAENRRLTQHTVLEICRWLGLEEEYSVREKLVTLDEEILRNPATGPRVIELLPGETLTVCTRRNALHGHWYLVVTDGQARETRVDEVHLGEVVYQARQG